MSRLTAVFTSVALVAASPGSSAFAVALSMPRVSAGKLPSGPAGLPTTLPTLSAPTPALPGRAAPALSMAALPQPAFAPAARPQALIGGLARTAVRLAAAVADKGEQAQSPRAAAVAFDGAGGGEVAELETGERVFASEPARSELDAQTLADLEVMRPRHGLHALLAGKARTAYGARRLERLVSRPFLDADEIRRRQAAARELSQDGAIRSKVAEAFDALGTRADAPARAGFFSFKIEKPVLAVGFVLGAAALSFLAAQAAASVSTGSPQPLLETLRWIFPWMMIGGAFVSRFQEMRAELLRYKAVVKLAAALAGPLSRAGSAALREIGAEFAAVADKSRIGGLAGRLSRLMPSSAALLPDFLYLHSGLTLWTAALGVARRRAALARLLGALSELDAYRALAETSRAHAGWSTYPEISDEKQPSLRIEQGHHPYLAARGASVGNDARLEPGRNFHLLTGVNMGGKSTYLKMTALLALLAQIGAPVPARAMALTPLELLTSIEIRHDLAEGKSLYDAETDRILEVIRRAEAGARLFVLVDEILQGTNPQDRAGIERAIVRYLARTGRLFLVATHNLDVVALEGAEPGVRNSHVEESSDGRATYAVLPGPSTTRNAVETLKRKGFPADIIRDSRR